ncbi:cytochrome P450 [Coprinellus micaceus]|uniref:Cytochrome P450 n=1 Tax=Coprinellus micaceus TaxID=71717 RepID=A0A4Y7U0J9_COPMI|nr:cytochrome P450 [Coprinellus micaceus]
MQHVELAVGALTVFWLTYRWYAFREARVKVDHIPTLGSDGFVGSYLGAWKYVYSGNKIVEEGYKKYKGAPFKVSTFETASRWLIIVSGRNMIDDIRKAPVDVLSLNEAALDMLQLRNTLGEKAARGDWYHVDVTTKQITRNMADLMPALMDEMREAFADLIPLSEEWLSIAPTKTFVRILCRMINRFFFPTLQLHRHPEFLDLQTVYPIQVLLSALALTQFPGPLRRLVAWLISPVPRSMKKMMDIVGPLLEERLKEELELGHNWEGRPNDLLSWFLESAPPDQLNVDDLLMRLMQLEFAAFHTSNVVISDALLDLAARPEYLQPLREEVEQVTDELGWTKQAFNTMPKLDSFLKESSRLEWALAAIRSAQKGFTFSNGLHIPAGFSSIYADSHIFDGFRFVMEDGDESSVNGFVAQDTNFLLCPPLTLPLGASVAAAELKAIMSHILINYDIRMPEESTTIAEGQFFNSSRGPDSSAKLQLRKRRT